MASAPGGSPYIHKYTIGPYPHGNASSGPRGSAEGVAQQSSIRLDPGDEKREAKRRVVADRVGGKPEDFIAQQASKNRCGGPRFKETSSERGKAMGGPEASMSSPVEMWLKSSQQLSNTARPGTANKTLKWIKSFPALGTVGRAILIDPRPRGRVRRRRSLRDRVLDDRELAQVILAARKGDHMEGVVKSSWRCDPRPGG